MLAVTKVISGIPMSHIALGLSVVCFLYALPALIEPKKFREALEEFFNLHNAAFRLAAFFHLLVAFLILNTHWTVKLSSTRSIMTVVGYLLLIRGILWLWFPDFVKWTSKKIILKENGVYVIAFVSLLLGAGFGYLGIWVY